MKVQSLIAKLDMSRNSTLRVFSELQKWPRNSTPRGAGRRPENCLDFVIEMDGKPLKNVLPEREFWNKIAQFQSILHIIVFVSYCVCVGGKMQKVFKNRIIWLIAKLDTLGDFSSRSRNSTCRVSRSVTVAVVRRIAAFVYGYWDFSL